MLTRRLFPLFFCVCLAHAAVAFNNTNTMTQTTGTSASSSFSVTNAGSNRAAFVCVLFDVSPSAAITSVTYGGNTMTSAGSPAFNNSSDDFAQIFYLVNPPTGSNTLTVTGNANVSELYVNLISYTGVDQTTPVRPSTYNTATGNSGSSSLTVTSNSSDLTMSCNTGAGQGAGTTNQTSDGTNNNGNHGGGSDHATTPASSVTHTWTFGGSTPWTIAGLSIQAAGAAPACSQQIALLGVGCK